MGRYFSKRAFKQRMKEPSTWAGFAVLADVFGASIGIPPGVLPMIVGTLAIGAGVLPEAPKE